MARGDEQVLNVSARKARPTADIVAKIEQRLLTMTLATEKREGVQPLNADFFKLQAARSRLGAKTRAARVAVRG